MDEHQQQQTSRQDSDRTQVESQVIAIVAKTAKRPADQVRLEHTFEELGLDSLDGVEIVYELEERFGITIPNESARGVRSVSDVVAALRTHLPSGA
ncbi:MAG TPA: acyl carrier protein [Gemmatimonadaceae bacterium]|nr:acyl carrier protein [Gemmatimonadaceae bacterium]